RTGILLITLLTNLLKGLVGDGRRQWGPAAKYPYASFFGQRGSSAHRSQRNFFAGALQFQRIARPQMQFFPERLGKQNATGAIDCDPRIHLWEPTFPEP